MEDKLNIYRRFTKWWFYRNFDWCIEALKNPEFEKTLDYQQKKRNTKTKGFIQMIIAVILFVAENYYLNLISHSNLILVFYFVVSFLFAFGIVKIFAGYAGFPPFPPEYLWEVASKNKEEKGG